MSNRPPSTRSTASAAPSLRRAPPAFRGSNVRPARAQPHVTLVFAHGDASITLPREPSLRRAICGASPSEEALSRQLDRDGQHMPLRSRRGSAATLASVRTDYSSHPLASPALQEEEIDEEPVAGPSRQTPTHSPTASYHPPTSLEPSPIPNTGVAASADASLAALLPTRDGATTPQRRHLNPKNSSSWLRWTSPTPTFPKKEKGKQRDDTHHISPLPSPLLAPTVPPSALIETPSAVGPAIIPTVPAPAPDIERARSGAPTRPTREAVKPAPPLPDEERTVSALLPGVSDISVPTPSALSSTAPSDAPEPTTPMLKPAQPALDVPTPSRGWRTYFWGGGPGGDTGGSSTPTPAPDVKAHKSSASPSPVVPASDITSTQNMATDAPHQPPIQNGAADHADPPALAKIESRGSALPNGTNGSAKTAMTVITNGSANVSVKRRKVEVPSPIVTERAAATPTTPTARSPTAATSVATATAPAPPSPTQSTTSSRDPTSDKQLVVVAAHLTHPPGWGSYFASFVYSTSQTRPPEQQMDSPAPDAPDMTPKADPAPLPAPAADDAPPTPSPAPVTARSMGPPPLPAQGMQQPAPPAQPAPSAQLAPPTPTPTPQPPPLGPADTESTPSNSHPKLASSTSSTAGWLSYLAFRASQKKITDSAASEYSDLRKSGETGREEVMDFSADPEFPTETPSTAVAVVAKPDPKAVSAPKGKAPSVSTEPIKGTKDAVKDAAKGAPPPSAAQAATSHQLAQKKSQTQLSTKRSQNLALDVRRGSIASSVRSASSAPPAPLSPRSQAALSAAKANSALPNPPQAPSKQPNFLVPTFATTFDRPPRSLLPRSAESVTATALRAFSYVYGGLDKDTETRGKKEGRDVGADLPRRIGLHGGNADDGWKNVKRVVVVGVHGWFPAKMLNSVIGEPTGTSQKFANMMGEAVKQFFRDKDIDEHEIRLTLIPLEGEGVIDDRVDKLYKAYLSNPAWINDLRRADAILFAAHSQGCVVTTHLISRMIAQGHIRTAHNREAVARCEWAFGPIAIVPSEDSKKGRRLAAALGGAEGGRQKVAMLAMCGVHLGPLYSISTSSVIGPYLQWFENAAARELFEFQDTNSAVAQAYHRSLSMILENEVRVLLVASLNDQVVPIYGASFANAEHPLLLRALFVDGASYSASDFMTNLLCFAFMLRNAGIDDQRLIEHLSEATAGSLTGVGHSSPYEERDCYSLCVNYLFHAGPAAQPLPPLQIEPFQARDARNDFELPWIMRALVDAPEVKDLFPAELKDLRESILAWKPQTKALREIKKRLEPMAGRQPRVRHLAASPSSTSLNAMGGGGAAGTVEPASPLPKGKVPSKLR